MNQELAFDFVVISSDPVLQIVDTHTHFSAGQCLTGADTGTICLKILTCWSRIYVGFPDSSLSDRGSVFPSSRWKSIGRAGGSELRYTLIESRSSLGVGERYHGPLRKIFCKIKIDYDQVDKKVLLALANQPMNYTFGPEGMVASLLIIGVVPRMPSVHSMVTEKRRRMEAIAMAQVEMEAITSDLRVRTGLRKRTTVSKASNILPGMQVLIYTERERKWVGPTLLDSVEGKTANIIEDAGNIKPFSVSAVKGYMSSGDAYNIYFQEVSDSLKIQHQGVCEEVQRKSVTEVLTWGTNAGRKAGSGRL